MHVWYEFQVIFCIIQYSVRHFYCTKSQLQLSLAVRFRFSYRFFHFYFSLCNIYLHVTAVSFWTVSSRFSSIRAVWYIVAKSIFFRNKWFFLDTLLSKLQIQIYTLGAALFPWVQFMSNTMPEVIYMQLGRDAVSNWPRPHSHDGTSILTSQLPAAHWGISGSMMDSSGLLGPLGIGCPE